MEPIKCLKKAYAFLLTASMALGNIFGDLSVITVNAENTSRTTEMELVNPSDLSDSLLDSAPAAPLLSSVKTKTIDSMEEQEERYRCSILTEEEYLFRDILLSCGFLKETDVDAYIDEVEDISFREDSAITVYREDDVWKVYAKENFDGTETIIPVTKDGIESAIEITDRTYMPVVSVIKEDEDEDNTGSFAITSSEHFREKVIFSAAFTEDETSVQAVKDSTLIYADYITFELFMDEEKPGYNVSVIFPQAVHGNDYRLFRVDENGVTEFSGIVDIKTNEAGEEYAAAVSFDTDTLGTFVFAYTKEFEYQIEDRPYEYVFETSDTVSIKDILIDTGVITEEFIDLFLSKAVSVESENTDLLDVELIDDVCYVTPQKKFETVNLTVTMEDGQIAVITVTDKRPDTSKEEAVTEPEDDEIDLVTIKATEDVLPEEAESRAEVVKGNEAEEAMVQAETAENTDVTTENSEYKVFDIGLDNVDTEEYESFDVEIKLNERAAVAGKNFKLYHIRDDGTVEEIPVEVVKTIDENGNEVVEYLTFQTPSFSKFVLVYEIETFYKDAYGDTWKITAEYDTLSGIPESAELRVSEIKEGEEGYEEYVSKSAEKIGSTPEQISKARAFDITIVNPVTGEVYQPNTNVKLSVQLMDNSIENSESLDVVHIHGESEEQVDLLESTVEGETVQFVTNGFSVYVIIPHEGGEVETPRVEFHFISPVGDDYEPTTIEGVVYYTSAPYSFENKATEQAYKTQTSLIVHDGDKLESIEAPMNTEHSYFYGWYTVDKSAVDSETGNITYSWPDDTKRVELDRTITISDVVKDSNGAVTSLKWTVDGVSQTVTSDIDADGCAHVYLAPIYDNYHFVNFHLGARRETIAANIMARKLTVLGNSGTTDVLISDIQAPSQDLVHLVFVGWEYDRNPNNDDSDPANNEDWYTIRTVDDNGEVIENVTITAGSETIDLYPVFVEIRWINYNIGESHNGAAYISPKFMYTSDYAAGDEYAISELATGTRVGYTFGGWYVNACMVDSEIKNLDGPYTDPDTGTVWSQAIKIANADGTFVDNTVKGYANDDGELVYTETTGYELAFKVEGRKLYVYEQLNSLTVYANWVAKETKYSIYFWQQNANDDEYTFADYAEMTGTAGATTDVTGSTSVTTEIGQKTSTIASLYTSDHFALSADQDKKTEGNQADIVQQTINGDNSTIVNVYYDRESYTLKFYFARTYEYNGYTFIQINNNNEGFTGTSYSNANSLITALTKKNGTYDDYTRTGGMNTWKDVASSSVTSPENLLDSTYLSNPNVSIGTQSITTNTTRFASGGGRTNVNNQQFTYYYVELNLKYGQSLAGLWPEAAVFYSQTISNYNYEQRGSAIYPIFWGSMGKGNVNASTTADASLVHNTQNNEGYYLLYWRFESTYKALFHVYYSALDGETADATYDGVSYVEQDGDPSTTQSLTGIVVSGVSDFSDIIATLYSGFTLKNGDSNNKVPSNPGSGTYHGTAYTRVFNGYYLRNNHDLILQTNVVASDTITDGTKTTGNKTVTNIPYGEHLTLQRIRDEVPDWIAGKTQRITADGAVYKFQGWFDNPGGSGTAVDFSTTTETMPDQNVTYYAVWQITKFRIRVNPDGGVIDHINYTNSTYVSMLAPTGLTNPETNPLYHTNYNSSYSTYFNNTSAEYINTDQDLKRPFVEITDAEAATMTEEPVYRYVNMQLDKDESHGTYASDARNALYILDTQASIDAYYQYYCKVIRDTGDGNPESLIPQALWESMYLSEEKYRQTRAGEKYRLLGWYEVLDYGTGNEHLDSKIYDFSKPTDHNTALRAAWQLEGGYTLQYTTEYYAPNNDYITANLPSWTDPADGSSKYADQATTFAMQEPTEIKINGGADPYKTYQFRGWQIVKVETVAGVPQYIPLQSGVYYTAGQPLKVEAKYSDADMIIHMQAVYELRSEAYRRPDVINLTLDASEDAMQPTPAGTGRVDPSKGTFPTWSYGNSYPDETAGKIYFGDTQSNAAVHLYQYATTLTADEITGAQLTPAGVNFFEHSAGYKLIGFDLDAKDTDFVPDYAADSVVTVTQGDSHILYAVWEPMVYLTFVNDTDVGDVTFNLTGTGQSMYIVNQMDGSFSRTPIDPNESITVKKGETLRFAVPYGEGSSFTVIGTNTLGIGCMLSANSKLGDTERTLTGVPNGEITDYRKVKNGEDFGFSDTFVVDPEGIIITFQAERAPHTLILKDNYNKDGTGGNTVEINFEETTEGVVYYINESDTSYELPSTGTRVGYEFVGWDANSAADSATYHGPSSWTIPNLTSFFGDDEIKTLYGIWTANAVSGTVYVWKDVEGPVDKDNETYTFTVSFSGGFSYEQYEKVNGQWKWINKTDEMSPSTGYDTTNMSVNFTLKHGEYLEINSSKIVPSGPNARPSMTVTVKRFDVNGNQVGSTSTLSWTWNHINDHNTSNRYGYFKFTTGVNGVNISAAEADPGIRFAVAEEIAAQASSTNLITVSTDERKADWNDEAGGTVIFHNTRRTADITIKKTQLPDTQEAENFPFAVTITNGTDGGTKYEGYTLSPTSKNIKSGTDGWTIEDVPTGAILQISELVDKNITGVENTKYSDLYDTKYMIGTAAEVTGSVATVTVSDDTTVIFTNTLKTQKVRIMVEDEDGNPLDSALFTFPNVFEGTKYAAEGTGIVGENSYTVYAGSYTLTEISMPNRLYQKLASPVTVMVKGSGVTVTPGDNVYVTTPENEDDPYIIHVVNPKLWRVTVKKIVEGGNTSGQFGFTAILKDSEGNLLANRADVINPGQSTAKGTDANGQVTFNLNHNQSVILYVPKNTNLVITETQDNSYRTEYQTGTNSSDIGEKTAGLSATFDSVTEDKYVLFTNTLKTVDITVRKTMLGNPVDGSYDYDFTLTLMNGPYQTIRDFKVYDDPDDDSKDLTTDSNGQVIFTLTNIVTGGNQTEGSIVFKIPVGAGIKLTENLTDEQKKETAVFMTMPGGEENLADGKSEVFEFYSRDENDDATVRVINIPSICKVTDGSGNLLYRELPGAIPGEASIHVPAIYGLIKDAFNDIDGKNLFSKSGTTFVNYEDKYEREHPGERAPYQVQMLTDYEVPNDDVVVVGDGHHLTFTTAKRNASDGYPFRREGVYTNFPEGVDTSMAANSIGKAVLTRPVDAEDAFFTVGSSTGSETVFEMSSLILDGSNATLTAKGGALTAYKTTATITDCVIYRFEAEEGGAVFTTGTSLTVTDSIFDTCKSDLAGDGNGGGGINTTVNTLTISGSTFRKCTAVHQAGAVYQVGTGNKTMNLTNCDFIECTSRSAGGVEADVRTVNVTDCNFIRCVATADVNSAGGNGGGLNNWYKQLDDSSKVTVTDCTFQGCSGKKSATGNGDCLGGGMRSSAKTTELTNCTFTDDDSNPAVHCSSDKLGGGAAFTNTSGTTTINDCTFNNCTAANGGGIYVTGTLNFAEESSATIQNCTATSTGGAIYTKGTSAQVNIKGGTISDNKADGYGGGAIRVEEGAKVTVTDGVISRNYITGNAERCGGAIGIKQGEVWIRGGTISENYATGSGNGTDKPVQAGAIFVDGRDTAILHVEGGTITGNYARATNNNGLAYGGAICVKSGGVFYLSGGTITGNYVQANNTANAKGAGIYLAEGSTLNISGNPSFGGADVKNEDETYTFTDDVGNLLPTTISATNGGQNYTKARQDIYIAGYSRNPAQSVNVTGEITSGVGAIWVWAEDGTSTHVAGDHIHKDDQFALHVLAENISESSLNAFRNARIDVDSGAGSSALYGVKSTVSGEESYVIWGTIGGADVFFKKVNGFGEGLGDAKFTLYKSLAGAKNQTSSDVVSISGNQVSNNVVTSATAVSTGIEVGDVNFRAPTGIWYMRETTAPTGYQANNNIYVVLVGSGNVTVPTTRTNEWAGVLENIIYQADINAQRGTLTNGKYERDSAIFLIDGDNKAVTTPDIGQFGIMNVNNPHMVILHKVAATTNQSLKNAKFRIFLSDGTELKEASYGYLAGEGGYKSVENGIYFIGPLPAGRYYVVETAAPDPVDSTSYGSAGTLYVLDVTENGTVSPQSAAGSISLNDIPTAIRDWIAAHPAA